MTKKRKLILSSMLPTVLLTPLVSAACKKESDYAKLAKSSIQIRIKKEYEDDLKNKLPSDVKSSFSIESNKMFEVYKTDTNEVLDNISIDINKAVPYNDAGVLYIEYDSAFKNKHTGKKLKKYVYLSNFKSTFEEPDNIKKINQAISFNKISPKNSSKHVITSIFSRATIPAIEIDWPTTQVILPDNIYSDAKLLKYSFGTDNEGIKNGYVFVDIEYKFGVNPEKPYVSGQEIGTKAQKIIIQEDIKVENFVGIDSITDDFLRYDKTKLADEFTIENISIKKANSGWNSSLKFSDDSKLEKVGEKELKLTCKFIASFKDFENKEVQVESKSYTFKIELE